jgi:hypothetical protein
VDMIGNDSDSQIEYHDYHKQLTAFIEHRTSNVPALHSHLFGPRRAGWGSVLPGLAP